MSASTERRDRELEDLIERIETTAEAAVTLAWEKGYRQGQFEALHPIARRMAAAGSNFDPYASRQQAVDHHV